MRDEAEIVSPIIAAPRNLVRDRGWTVAHLLFGVLAFAAAILRLAQLGALPLNSAESREALATYQFATHGLTESIGSPAYFNLTALTQFIFGNGDGAMRIVPAAFGLASVLLLWQLRPQLGSIGTLVTTLLLTISPVHSAITRSAGGDAIAIFASLLLLLTIVQTARPNAQRSLLLAAALALGVSSSPLFFSLAATLVVAALLAQFFAASTFDFSALRPHAQQAAIAFALLFVAVATLFFSVPEGLGASADLLMVWLQQFAFGSGVLDPLIALVRYEPIALLLGIIALIWSLIVRPINPLYRLLTFWFIAALVLVLLQAGVVANAALLTLPLYLLCGLVANELLASSNDWRIGGVAGGMTLWGVLALVNIGRFLRMESNFAPLLIAALVLCAAGFFTLVLMPNTNSVGRGVLLGVLGIAVFYSWGTAWSLTRELGNDPREPWVTVGSDSDLRLLRSTLQESSYQLTAGSHALEIITAADSPPLRWYLRDFTNVSYVELIPRGATAQAIIAPEPTIPALDGLYGQAMFDHLVIESAETTPLTPIETFRWWFFQDNPTLVKKERISVWLRLE